MIARNEIYARNGRLFVDQNIQKYFDSKSWYNGHISPNHFGDNLLNKIEKENIQRILSVEKQ